jgi:predicted nucleotidyltransferase
MNRLIQKHRQEVMRLCSTHGVRRLELFGSAVRGDFDATASDLDFLVEFESMTRGDLVDHYFGLREDLEELFGRPIDLVMTRAIDNPYFLRSIEGSRTLLYAA